MLKFSHRKIKGRAIKTLAAITTACSLALGLSAIGQVDPDPNGIGIYFDETAEVNSVVVEVGTIAGTAYLILTNPALEGTLRHWTATVTVDQANVWGGVVAGFNLALNIPYSSHFSFEVLVDELEEYPTTSATVLATLNVVDPVGDQPIHFYVSEGAEYTVWNAGTSSVAPSSGSWLLPVAAINDDAPVPSDASSWGAVKALYR